MSNTKTIDDFIKDMEKFVKRIKKINSAQIDLPEEISIKRQLINREVIKLYV
jgi:hypothetical protein